MGGSGVFQEGNGKGHGVRIESAATHKRGVPSRVLARPGDVLGLIAGAVCPPGSTAAGSVRAGSVRPEATAAGSTTGSVVTLRSDLLTC